MPVSIINSDKFLTFVTPPGKSVSLKAGAVVRAEVIDVVETGEVTLRVILPVDEGKYGQGSLIKARSEVPLTKGQDIYLEILGGDKDIKMRFIGNAQDTAKSESDNVSANLFKMLAELSGSKLSSSEFKFLLNTLKSLTEDMKVVLSELKGLEKFFSEMKQLNGSLLKAIVEDSGVLFETRLKLSILKGLADSREPASRDLLLQTEGDIKGMLLKLRELLKDQNIIEALKLAGLRGKEIADTVDKFIKNIEFFQLTSKVNDMLYTFLPVLWDDLKDGELLFKKNSDDNQDSYTCNINLELEPLGRLSISLTMFDKAFYITFLTERLDARDIINSEKQAIEERFASLGLALKAINVNQKHNIEFGQTQNHEVNLKA